MTESQNNNKNNNKNNNFIFIVIIDTSVTGEVQKAVPTPIN